MLAGPGDPIASLRTFPIAVTLGGVELTLGPRPALAWLQILADDPPPLEMIIPGMLEPDDQFILDDLILAGRVGLEDIGEAILDAVGVATGRPWWTALMLIRGLQSSNRPLFIRATAGVDLERIPLGAWWDLVYADLTRHMAHEDRTKFDMNLTTPPPGVQAEPEELIDEQASSAAFFGMMQQPAR